MPDVHGLTAPSAPGDRIRFLTRLLARPKAIGAILPSGPALARAMVSRIDPRLRGPVLELGSGTGVFTAALLDLGIEARRLIAVESGPGLARRLRARFPGLRVIEADAFGLGPHPHAWNGPYAGIVSGIPLLNHPPERRRALIAGLVDNLLPGASLMQFSYGLRPPVEGLTGVRVRRIASIWRNVPPARVWGYSKRGPDGRATRKETHHA